jgi:hypothetical protein
MMVRTALRVACAAGLLLVTIAPGARAAGQVVLAVSPADVQVGEPVEVLLRTFAPIGQAGLPLPTVRDPYPAPSGYWNVLMPWNDYPFDVVAQSQDHADIPVRLARDPSDSTLWRGTVLLPSAGTWTIWVRNYQNKEPGSTTTVSVRRGTAATSSPPPSATATSSPSIWQAALAGAILGLVMGAVLGLVWSHRTAS